MPEQMEETSSDRPQTIKKPKSIFQNSIFLLIYNVLNVVFPFMTGVYVAHVLSPTNVGEVAFAQNIAQYFVILAFLGLPTYGLREISKVRNQREELEKIYSELFFLNLVSTCIFTAIYLVLIFSVSAFRDNLPLYLIVGLVIALNALDNSWLYEGLEEFKMIAIRNVAVKLVAFILLIVFVKQSSDYYLYPTIMSIAVAGNNLFNILFARKFVRLRVKGLNIKRHLKPVLLLVVVNLAIEIYTLVDTTMLGFYYPRDVVAFYTYGSKVNRILLQIVNTFTIVIVPRLSLCRKEENSKEFNRLLSKTMRIILILSLPMIVGVQFVSHFLIGEIYGEAYLSSARVLQILCIVLLVSPIGFLLGSRVLLVSNQEWKMGVCVGIGAVVNIIGNAILIPHLREYGAALASVISETVVMVAYVLTAKKYFRMESMFGTLLKTVIASAAMGGYLYGCSFLPLNGWAVFFIQFFGAVFLYFALLILMRENTVLTSIEKVLAKKRTPAKPREKTH